MRQTIARVVMAAGLLLLAGCEAKETFSLLTKPIHVQADINPTFGAPIASGEMQLNELLDRLGSEAMDFLVEDSQTVTLRYTMPEFHDSVVMSDYIQPTTVRKPNIFTKDNLIDQSDTLWTAVDINFWDDVDLPGLEPGNIAINHLWLNFKLKVKGNCPPEQEAYINSIIHASIKGIMVKYVDYFGNSKEYNSADIASISLPIDNLLEGDSVERTLDVADLIDEMPRSVELGLIFDLGIDEEVLGIDLFNLQDVLAEIGLTDIHYWVNADVTMPLDVKIGALSYNFPLDLGDNVPDINAMLNDIAEGVSVSVDNSKIVMSLDNGIPLSLGIEAYLLDNNEQRINSTSLINGQMNGAPVAANGLANGESHEKMEVSVSNQTLADLARASQLQLVVTMGTTRNSQGEPQFVKIRREDKLKMNLYAILHTNASADIEVFGGLPDLPF